MRVVFRCDASRVIGSGHVYRCLTLAKQLIKMGCECHFISQPLPDALLSLLAEAKVSVSFIEDHSAAQLPEDYASWLSGDVLHDAEQTRKALIDLDQSLADWLILDHYGMTNAGLQVLRKNVRRLGVIDDLADRTLDCDWLLNQTMVASGDLYQQHVKQSTTLLLGQKYCLLRDEFSQARADVIPQAASSSDVENTRKLRLLISLGGSDSENLAGELLANLDAYVRSQRQASPDYQFTYHIDLVVGATNPHLQSLHTWAESTVLGVDIHCQVKDMLTVMQQADLSIGACGSSAWERCCVGLPTLVVQQAANQQPICDLLRKEGAALIAQPEQLQDAPRLLSLLQQVWMSRDSLKANAMRLIDGAGTQRVGLSLLLQDVAGQQISLRAAEQDDSELVYHWQCLPQTRQFARNPNPPSRQEHQAWWQARWRWVDNRFYIIQYNQQDVGMVRLDPCSQQKAPDHEVSIFISPDYYRRGIAEAALRLVAKIHYQDNIYATVLRENKASMKLFIRAGYKQIAEERFLLASTIDSAQTGVE